MPEAVLAGLLVAGGVAVGWAGATLAGRCVALERRLHRAEAARREAALAATMKTEAEAAQRVVEGTVEVSTAAVRAVHGGIASIPFALLEASPVTRPAARVVRGVHDVVAGAVYGSITGVNRGLGLVTRGVLRIRGRRPREPET